MLMKASRSAMAGPTFPRRSKLAQSVAITQSKCFPIFGLSISLRVSKKASFAGISSSFQHTTSLPWSCSAQARASCAPMQSPSGRTCPATQIVWLLRTISRIFWINCLVLDSEITVSTFVIAWGGGLLKFGDDRQDPVAAHDGIVHHEMQARDVFQKNGFGHKILNARAIFLQERQPGSLLFGA